MRPGDAFRKQVHNDGLVYFKINGTGEWLELSPNPLLSSWTIEDILINTRSAADAAGPTMMDRKDYLFDTRLASVATTAINSFSSMGFGR